MKLLNLILLLIFTTALSFPSVAEDSHSRGNAKKSIENTSSNPFITTWKTDNQGFSTDQQIKLYAVGTYDISWVEVDNPSNTGTAVGDGITTITFPTSGIYEVSITGNLERMNTLGNFSDAKKLLTIEQWGDISWVSMSHAFKDCSNMTMNATDAPDLSNVTSMDHMFEGAHLFNGDINHWDVSNVTIMSNMFKEATFFNQPLDNWDVSNVWTMSNMFHGAVTFNQPLDNWDMSNVTNTSLMFDDAFTFNQPLDNWDVSNVTNMVAMFRGAFRFNQPLSNWDVSNVEAMRAMFEEANYFNQDLDNWDVSNVYDMKFMFKDAVSFNQALDNWDISKVEDMYNMLSGSNLSIENYDNTLISWASQNVQPDINLNAGGLYYCSAALPRLSLIENHGWNISDDLTTCVADIYVDHTATGNNTGTSWEDAFIDLQDALAMGPGHIIHISRGEYYPTSGTSRGKSFDIPSETYLLGGYPYGGGLRNANTYKTILSGEIDDNPDHSGNSYHVVKISNASDVSLNGIRIQYGNADNANSFGRSRGGGLYANGSSIHFNNCIIQDNKAIYGGGMFATLSPKITFINCKIERNEANNGSALYHSNQTNMYIYKSRITDNNSLVRCAIEVNNSLFTHIENTVIADNASTNANAIALIATNRNQSCNIIHSTIVGESKDKKLITFIVGYGDLLEVNMSNSIVAHQDLSFSNNIGAFNNGQLDFTYNNCYFQGSSVNIGQGTNNLFSDTSGDLLLKWNYSVNDCSPVVDAGYYDVSSTILTDIDGEPRNVNIVDIGAYEAQDPCDDFFRLAEKRTTKSLSTNFNIDISNIYPNPSKDVLNIQYNLKEDTDISFSILDIRGQLVKSYSSESIQKGTHLKNLDVSFLNSGLYFMQIRTNLGQETFKFEKI